MDPGQALRNDGLNPPRPPTLGGRLRESGIQAAETVIAGAAAGAAATRSVTENQTTLALRGGGDWLDRTLRIPTGHRDWHHCRTKCRPRKSSGGPQKWSPCWRGRGNGRWRWNGKPPRTSRASLPSSSRKRKHRKASPLLRRQRREQRRRLRRRRREVAPWRCWAKEPWRRREPWVRRRGLAVAGAGAALRLMGWGAATGGGTDSDASRPSMTTDVQTLNGTQESGAVSRPARRPRPQAQTPFGLNNVPIPVSSGSERSRVSRQSRGDRGPLGTQPSFEALRQASEPEAA